MVLIPAAFSESISSCVNQVSQWLANVASTVSGYAFAYALHITVQIGLSTQKYGIGSWTHDSVEMHVEQLYLQNCPPISDQAKVQQNFRRLFD
jgi:hypothetical protein